MSNEDDNLDPITGADDAADSTASAGADDVAADGAVAEESADSDANDNVDLEKVGAGVAAGSVSARAAARQAGARSGVTAPKGAPTQARNRDEASEGNVLSRLGRFLREVIAELGKVIWPNQKQMVTYTIVVLLFLIFMIALVAGLDLLFGWGVRSVFG